MMDETKLLDFLITKIKNIEDIFDKCPVEGMECAELSGKLDAYKEIFELVKTSNKN